MTKNTKTLAIALTVALAAALSPSAIWGQEVCPGPAKATKCTIDNFTSGYGLVKSLTTGSEEVNQPPLPATGSGIVDGTRSIILTSGSGATNQFGQPTQAQTVRKSSTNPTPALVWSNGYGNDSLLQVLYGATGYGAAPMNLDLTQYNSDSNGRIRFTFAGAQQGVNFNVEVYDSSGAAGNDCGINLDPSLTSFTLDAPFNQFGNPDIDWGDITGILFEVQNAFNVGAPNLAVTDIEVIAATSSTPPATYTCSVPQ